MPKACWRQDWLADDAVVIAPVSAAISLLTGKFAGNFRKLGPFSCLIFHRSPCATEVSCAIGRIPNREFYCTKQGFWPQEQGILYATGFRQTKCPRVSGKLPFPYRMDYEMNAVHIVKKGPATAKSERISTAVRCLAFSIAAHGPHASRRRVGDTAALKSESRLG